MAIVVKTCPCGRPLPYAECCGPAHDGAAPATAEALMRSRYSAFALGDVDYLQHSWHPDTRPRKLVADDTRWTGLDVVDTSGGGLFDTEGEVEFVARYQGGDMRERSRFTRYEGRWVYVGPIA